MSPAAGPVVSVVTPFYNTEAYLAECIESVLAQSYRDWEYVLVDNRSTDRSAEIAASYAARDGRIRLVRNETFLSQVRNYNHALRQIAPTSRYCKVVQADDRLFPDCLRDMVSVAEQDPAVGVVGAYGLFGTNVYLDGLPYPTTLMPGAEACRAFLLRGLYVFGTPTSLLLRADLVRGRDPFYEEGNPFEDAEVCFELLRDHRFGYVHQVLTFTRRDNDSLMTGIARHQPFLLMRVRAVQRYGPAFLTAAEYRACRAQTLHHYYLMLGESVLRRRRGGFWTFHRRGLAGVGLRLDWARVALYALLAALMLALNPLDTLTRIWRRLTRRHRLTAF